MNREELIGWMVALACVSISGGAVFAHSSGEMGEFGTAPAFASSAALDEDTGTRIEMDRRFDTTGAVHATNEGILLHTDQVDGYPDAERPVVEADEKTQEINRMSIFLFLAAMLAFVAGYLLIRE